MLSIAFVVIYRYFWSSISQWREDQSTNIWLALTETLSTTPVGLLSSKDIPVPNGMVIFGKFFNLIDNLLIATILFSLIQILCFFLLINQLQIGEYKKLSLLLLLSFSTVLSSSSVEFWNQFIFIIFNSLFFYFYLLFLKSRETLYLFVMLIISTLPASVYLAGILNTLILGIIVIYEFVSTKDKKTANKSIQKYTLLSIFTLLYSYFVWIQYFRNVRLKDILSFTDLTLYDRINILSDQFLQIPGLFLTAWSKQQSFFILQIDRDIVSNISFNLFKVYVELHKVITVFFLLSLILILLNKKSKEIKFEPLLARFIFSILFFIFASSLISPVLGGPNFVSFERMDNYIQYYPFYIILWFLIIDKASDFNIRNLKIKRINGLIFIISILISFSLSFSVIFDNLNYSGDKLTESDVPLIEKMKVTKYIAGDMEKKEISKAKISYQLGGGIWDWIPEHSKIYENWYPQYPYTIGRVYDYILYTQYSINNVYEGQNIRDFDDSDYVVSYVFNSPDLDNEKNYKEVIFNRLRVSIRDNK